MLQENKVESGRAWLHFWTVCPTVGTTRYEGLLGAQCPHPREGNDSPEGGKWGKLDRVKEGHEERQRLFMSSEIPQSWGLSPYWARG